jgi:hypothetical protein
VNSVADPGWLSRTRIRIFPYRIHGEKKFRDPESGSATKILPIFKPKKLFLSSLKYDPGMFIPDPDLQNG